MTHLLELRGRLEARDLRFRSLTEGVETETPASCLILHVLAALAQFERDLIRERLRAGVASAIKRGVKFGASFKLKENDMPDVWRKIREEGQRQTDVAAEYGVSTQTITRRLKAYEAVKMHPNQRSTRKT